MKSSTFRFMDALLTLRCCSMLMPVKKVKIISASTVGSILGFSVSTFLATLLAKTAEGRVTDRRPARLGKHRAVPEARALQLGGSEGLLLDQFHEPVRCDPRAAQEVVSKSYAGLRDLIANDQSWKVSPAEGRRGDLRDAPSMREALPPPSAQDGGDSLAAQRDQHPQDQRLARALLARNHPGLP